MWSNESQVKCGNCLSQSSGKAPIDTGAVGAGCWQKLPVLTAGSCTACSLPRPQVLLSRVAPRRVRLQPVLFSTTQHQLCCWEGRLWVLPSWGSRLLLEGSSSQWQDFAFVPFLIHIMLVSPFFELTFQWPCLYQLLLPIYCHPQTWLQHTQFLFINKGDNRAGPSRYHYATPLVACFQLKYDPLTITLWAQSCN